MMISRKLLSASIIVASLILGSFFRLHRLGSSPHGLYVDEASLGYNAYSIIKTGKDEYGKSFPIMFRSFATFQSPIYTYAIIPFIPLFGVSTLSVRLPSAIFGILTLPVFYLLVKKISPRQYVKKLSLISLVFLSLSPWHIQYSRTAYETNLALFFLILGSLFFLHGLKRPWLLILSTLNLALSFNSYRAETLIVPLTVASLVYFHRQTIIKNFRSLLFPVIISLVIGLSLTLPTISIMKTPGFNARTAELNIFSYNRAKPWGYLDGDISLHDKRNYLPALSFREFASLYLSYFSPRYLFSLGDSGPRKAYPDLATFFVWQLPLYLFGVYHLIRDKKITRFRGFLVTLLLVSPIPAALTRDPYSTLRSLPLVIPQTIIISIGLTNILKINWRAINRFRYHLILILILLSTGKMYLSIFFHHDYYRSQHWNYGWQETVEAIGEIPDNLPVIIDNSKGDVYILYLFFSQYDPKTYQLDNFEISEANYYTDMRRVSLKKMGKVIVKNFQWGIDTDNVEQYIVADPIAISDPQINYHQLSVIKTINYPNGDIALRILKTNPQTKN